MLKITPHLWYDKEAKEAADLYVSTFPDSSIKSTVMLHDTPGGDAAMVNINLMGMDFTLISAGPIFKFTPAISFLVACETAEEVDAIWAKLSPGGTALMELGSYPFSGRYGWLQDKYGLSWQIMLTDIHAMKQRIVPTLMFVGNVCGKSEEAMAYYASIFHHANIGDIMRYAHGEGPDAAGTIKHASFTLEGVDFATMDSAHEHNFTFTEAISFIVHCETQEEIDEYWSKLSAVPQAEQCGWLKDKYGVSWQIVPIAMEKMLSTGTPEQITRVTQAFLKMKKFNIADLQRAFDGNA